MLERLFDNVAHVLVGRLIEYVLADLIVLDQTVLSQDLELMGNRRLGHTESGCNVTNAHRRAINGKEYTESGGITKYLEKVGQIVESGRLGELLPALAYEIAVLLMSLALVEMLVDNIGH